MDETYQILTQPENQPPLDHHTTIDTTMPIDETHQNQSQPSNPPPLDHHSTIDTMSTDESHQNQTQPSNQPPLDHHSTIDTTMPIDESHQIQTQPSHPPPLDLYTVDTTRPFRSVKEAIAIFGERLQLPEIYSPSPKPHFTLPKQETPIWQSTPNTNQTLWKSPETGQDPSPVVMNTLKKLELELNETKRELKMLKERESETEVALATLNAELHKNMSKIAKAEAEVAGKAVAMRSSSMTLRQVLSGGDETERGRERKYLIEKKVLKKKPVVPLVTDWFAWKNGKVIHC